MTRNNHAVRPRLERFCNWVLTAGSDELSRRFAAYQFDRGVSWQPSNHAKRRHLLELFHSRGHRTLIESGTYLGDTVAFFVGRADQILSVELDPRLYDRAVDRFSGESSVTIHHGDALRAIPQLVGASPDAPLVWLDGHFSGEGTAAGELEEPAPALLSSLAAVAPAGSTIVVDDLRLFGAVPDYPSLHELVDAAYQAFPSARIRVGLDALVIEL
ncbi:MAG TPA: hypothetical protein VHJ82_09065 [Actinomycetota bacterium]|nr:hypothetical protein [Actinomycetota bacterium]